MNSIFLFILLIRQAWPQIPPVVPITNALTAVYCHNSEEAGILTIRCRPNEKIRMLDAFDAASKNKSHLPNQCLKANSSSSSSTMDCKVHTSFTSACSGRENCTLHMQRIRLNSAKDNCHNQLVDYTMAFFECISDVFIHNVCSSRAITSAWGTLQTPNFPNPYTSSDDCWCKLSTQLQHRLLLSIISFQLIPYDQHCAGAGLYLQSSNEQRSTQCTYLQQGHNYLSDTNSLYINFYSRTPTVRGGFWIIYEASHPNAEVHLHCGPREKIGVPAMSPSSVSTPFDHGWSRLAFNNPPNPTTPMAEHMMRLHMSVTTPSTSRYPNSRINTSTAIGAFTYPHGALTTFDLAYGPRGWYLKHPFDSSSRTFIINSLRTTAAPRSPVVRWNYTWRYTRPPRKHLFKTKNATITTTSTTAEPTTEIPTTSIEETTVEFSSTPIPITTTRTITAQQRLLFTHKPWIYYNFSASHLLSTSTKSIAESKTHVSGLAADHTATLPMPTPWYSPAGPFDWWQWQWYTTKNRKSSLKTHSNKSTKTTITTTTTTTTTSAQVTRATTTTRRTTMRSSTTAFRLTNRTSTQSKATVDRFKRPDRTSSKATTESRSDDFEKEYKEWVQYLTTDQMPDEITSTAITPLTSISPRQQYQAIGHLPTKSTWKLVTINTPPAKRQQPSNSVVSERNALATQMNEASTSSNVQNMIRRVIEQRNKKHAMEYGWLSKTDMTIVAVSVLFVVLLAIINLILFAVRRHRHRLQGRHLLSTSISSSFDDRRRGGNGHLQSSTFGDATNSLINITNGNNNDILPAVGEIVIWDEKDQGGYMIDNNGSWAKIEGRQWFGSNIFKSCSKTSISKSFRSRFRFIRHLEKKTNQQLPPPMSPKNQQQPFKYPLLMDTATLSPVPEADDYESSDLSLSDVVIRSSTTTVNQSNKRQLQQPLIKSDRRHDLSPQTSKTVQALIHAEQSSDDYYKRIAHSGEDSNYAQMAGNNGGTSSAEDQETDRSLGNEIDTGGPIMLGVSSMVRRDDDDDAATNTDAGDSIYNPNYSIHSIVENTHPSYLQPNNHAVMFTTKPSISTFKPTTTNPVIIGFCQTEFQPLDPKLLFKTSDKISLTEQQQQFFRCSQSAQLSTYDSGFVDDQTAESSTTGNPMSASENNLANEHMNTDDILLTKSEAVEDDDEDEEDFQGNDLEYNENKRQKWKAVAKRVSFQEEHVTQRFSPPLSSIDPTSNPDTSSNPLDGCDGTPNAPPLQKSFFNDPSLTTSSMFIVPKQGTSIDNEDNTQTIIMNHLHSVKSLKKFFETKMVVQRLSPPSLHVMPANEEQKVDRTSMSKEQRPTGELEQRQEMMNKVLNSLKKKTVYTRTNNDTPEPNSRTSAMTTSSYDSTITQNLAVHRHYSRRFRSSSTSNNSLYPGGNIITHINLSHSHHHNKRAHSHERPHYPTTDHQSNNLDQHRSIDSDEEDNISENSMLWQARTKLNEFVTRTKKNQQQSPYYTTCSNSGTPIDDLDIYDDNESVTAETRF